MKQEQVITTAFFTILLITGLLIYDDYGISYDEELQREIGLVNYNYIFHGDKSLLSNNLKIYPSLFDIVLMIIEKGLGLTDMRTIFLIRHLVTFLLFYTSVIFFYKILKDYFNWKWALLGCVFLILSPRIFANSFYNNKDLAFMSVFTITLYTMNRLIKKQNIKNALIHGLTSGILIDMRILGLLIPVFTILFIIPKIKQNDETNKLMLNLKGKKLVFELNKTITSITFYLISMAFFIILFWPILWENPVYYFIEAISKLSKSYFWKTTVFYFGNYINCNELPWHYAPVWIFMTTPILYTTLFIIGSGSIMYNLIKFKKKEKLLFFLLTYTPVIVFITYNLSLYNGWRHLYFIYPMIVIIAIEGLKTILSQIDKLKPKIRINEWLFKLKKTVFIILAGLIITSLVNTLITMINLHPYQYVYFNPLLNHNMSAVKQNFPLDYWGVSIIEALEYIVKNDQRDNISIYSYNKPARLLLKKEDRERLSYAKHPLVGDYFIANYDHYQEDYTEGEEVFRIKIGSAKILAVNQQEVTEETIRLIESMGYK